MPSVRFLNAREIHLKRKSELSHLKNIGPTIERRLNEIGVYTRADLERLGPAKAYQWICRSYPKQAIPVCYYLYSLQGALTGVHWDKVPERARSQLLLQAGKKEGSRLASR